MKKVHLIGMISMLLISLIIVSCNKSPFKGYKKTESGLYYKWYVQNKDAQKPIIGDLLVLHYQLKSSKDSIFSDTYKNPEPVTIPLIAPTFKGDLYEGFAMMGKGDSASFIINADSFFILMIGAPRPEFIDSGSFITATVKLIDIKTKEEMDRQKQQELETFKLKETEDLAKYIKENNISTQPNEEGLYIIEVKKGTGRFPENGHIAMLNYDVSLIDGNKFYTSTVAGESLPYQVGSGQMGAGFDQAIKQVKVGGKAKFIIPSSQAFGEQGGGNVIPPYAPLIFEVELTGTYTEAEFQKHQEQMDKKKEKQENEELAKFLSSNKITAKKTISGLYHIEIKTGIGKQAEKGKIVKVHYTGTLLDGTKFDSSLDRGEPIEFELGAGQVIKGWDEGIALMKEGGKAKFIIPSSLAYGKTGRGQEIKPFSALIFEVELIQVN